jgi:hypothetical protein
VTSSILVALEVCQANSPDPDGPFNSNVQFNIENPQRIRCRHFCLYYRKESVAWFTIFAETTGFDCFFEVFFRS